MATISIIMIDKLNEEHENLLKKIMSGKIRAK